MLFPSVLPAISQITVTKVVIFWKHALMKNPRNKNEVIFITVENHMTPMLYPTQARKYFITGAS